MKNIVLVTLMLTRFIHYFIIDEERFDHDDDEDSALTTKRGRVSHVCVCVYVCVHVYVYV